MKLTKYSFNGSFWRLEMSGTVEEIDSYLIRLYNMGATDATFEKKEIETFHTINLSQKRWEDALTGWLMIQNAESINQRKACRMIQRTRKDKIPVYSQLMRRIAQEEIAAIPIGQIEFFQKRNKIYHDAGFALRTRVDYEAEMMENVVEIPHKFNCSRGANVQNFSCHATAKE